MLWKTYPCRFNVLAAYNIEDAKRLRDLIREQDKQAIWLNSNKGTKCEIGRRPLSVPESYPPIHPEGSIDNSTLFSG
jgi:hypothetical protein